LTPASRPASSVWDFQRGILFLPLTRFNAFIHQAIAITEGHGAGVITFIAIGEMGKGSRLYAVQLPEEQMRVACEEADRVEERTVPL
jgi:hypothetical protein